MKKFYMILAALLIGSMCFAQTLDLKLRKVNVPTSGAERSSWVGSVAMDGLASMDQGQEYAIAPKAFDANLSGNITKVKFYHAYETDVEQGETPLTNTSYTIKIYTNPVLGGTYASQGIYELNATEAYTQNFTAGTESGWQEVELTTPFAVPSGDFWVAIKANNGAAALPVGGAASAVEGQTYCQYDLSSYGLGVMWVTPEFGSQGNSTLYTIAMAIYVDDGAVYVPTSDLEVRWFGGISNNQLTEAQASYNLSTTESLTLLPFFANNGADDAVEGTVTFSITAGGQALIDPVSITLDGTEEGTIPVGAWYNLIDNPYSLTLSADDMDAMNLTNFEICLTVTYTGNDPVTTNNSHCISVTRGGETPQTSSDLEAMLFTDAQGTSVVGSTLTLAGDEDFIVFPAIKNNGPDDAASGSVTINVTMDGSPLIQPQSIALSSSQSIPNGQVVGITQNGLSLTAAQMDQYGITGTFEICFTISYSGTDPNTANNSKCVTVTRMPVSVEENIAEEVSVYPNPANDMFTVANAEGATILVVNSLGQVVASIENAASNQTIDASNFANGTYFVKVNESVIKINVVK